MSACADPDTGLDTEAQRHAESVHPSTLHKAPSIGSDDDNDWTCSICLVRPCSRRQHCLVRRKESGADNPDLTCFTCLEAMQLPAALSGVAMEGQLGACWHDPACLPAPALPAYLS